MVDAFAEWFLRVIGAACFFIAGVCWLVSYPGTVAMLAAGVGTWALARPAPGARTVTLSRRARMRIATVALAAAAAAAAAVPVTYVIAHHGVCWSEVSGGPMCCCGPGVPVR